MLDILDRYGAKASFFCVGERVAAHPEVAREIARRGHTVESHSHRHSTTFALYGLGALKREVQAAQAEIARLPRPLGSNRYPLILGLPGKS